MDSSRIQKFPLPGHELLPSGPFFQTQAGEHGSTGNKRGVQAKLLRCLVTNLFELIGPGLFGIGGAKALSLEAFWECLGRK